MCVSPVWRENTHTPFLEGTAEPLGMVHSDVCGKLGSPSLMSCSGILPRS